MACIIFSTAFYNIELFFEIVVNQGKNGISKKHGIIGIWVTTTSTRTIVIIRETAFYILEISDSKTHCFIIIAEASRTSVRCLDGRMRPTYSAGLHWDGKWKLCFWSDLCSCWNLLTGGSSHAQTTVISQYDDLAYVTRIYINRLQWI